MYQSSTLRAHPVLVAVLHGDAPFSKPDYQDTFAAKLAAGNGDVIAAAILRPGYTDPAGNTSDGERGETTGDNYNAGNVDAIAAAIVELRQRYQPSRVVVVGHSGGAAIAANLLSRHPALADAALLVSCPCDVPRWREHMFRKTGFAGFQGPVTTLSPLDGIATIPSRTMVSMIVGADDDVTPASLSESYRTAMVAQGKLVKLVLLPGWGHEILLTPEVLEATVVLLR